MLKYEFKIGGEEDVVESEREGDPKTGIGREVVIESGRGS